MSVKLTALWFAFLIPAATAHARPPAPSPNFCSHGLCLEISGLREADVEVATSSIKGKSRISIHNTTSRTTVDYSLGGECSFTREILLKRNGAAYSGDGCLLLPGQADKWLHISVEHTPVEGASRELVNWRFPLLHVWSVDAAPLSFWKSGYALRVGEDSKVKLPLLAMPAD